MSTQLIFARDAQGYNAYAPKIPVDMYTATLEANTATSLTVPSNFSEWVMYVRVQPDGWCWVSKSTASAPASGLLVASNSELICGTIEYRRAVKAGDVLNFITSNATCDIHVAFQTISYTG